VESYSFKIIVPYSVVSSTSRSLLTGAVVGLTAGLVVTTFLTGAFAFVFCCAVAARLPITNKASNIRFILYNDFHFDSFTSDNTAE
jgi:hypothetical protein